VTEPGRRGRSTDALAEAAARIDGADAVRPATEADAVDGVPPRLVVEPPTADALAATLAWAAGEGLRVLPRGGGTKPGWGPPRAGVDLVLSTARLDALLAHRHGDLTATVQAGAPLARVNAELARHGQWIALDPPFAERATIGGIVATNDSGPRRQRHGAPRDLLIGIAMARADGVLAKAGGIVVKNVAGYDLGKLLAGSFGTLAVITEATFKLAPLPPASRTVVAGPAGLDPLGALAMALAGGQLVPTAIELALPPGELLVRFESAEAGAVGQAEAAADLARAQAGDARIVSGEEEAALWAAHAARPWAGPGAVVRLSLLPSELADQVGWLQKTCSAESVGPEIVGRAGIGLLLVRLDGPPEAQARVVTGLRARLPAGRGSAVVRRGSPELRALLDPWGPLGDGLALMRSVKARFDPAGILAPGHGPGGL